MPITKGTWTLGPDTATLTVRTGKAGAAAKAGHDLHIEVTAWEATLDVGDDPAQTTMTLTAGSHSLRVRKGTGGMSSLDADDMAGIDQTIREEVLKGTAIAFRSTAVTPGLDGTLAIAGQLELNGRTQPVAFTLGLSADGQLTGTAVVKQSDFGMKPYSALFGTLKVTDPVEIDIDARLPTTGPTEV